MNRVFSFGGLKILLVGIALGVIASGAGLFLLSQGASSTIAENSTQDNAFIAADDTNASPVEVLVVEAERNGPVEADQTPEPVAVASTPAPSVLVQEEPKQITKPATPNVPDVQPGYRAPTADLVCRLKGQVYHPSLNSQDPQVASRNLYTWGVNIMRACGEPDVLTIPMDSVAFSLLAPGDTYSLELGYTPRYLVLARTSTSLDIRYQRDAEYNTTGLSDFTGLSIELNADGEYEAWSNTGTVEGGFGFGGGGVVDHLNQINSHKEALTRLEAYLKS